MVLGSNQIGNGGAIPKQGAYHREGTVLPGGGANKRNVRQTLFGSVYISWCLIGRVDSHRPEGHGFESRSFLGGSLLESIAIDQRVVGSNPALAAMYGPWASPSLTVAC